MAVPRQNRLRSMTSAEHTAHSALRSTIGIADSGVRVDAWVDRRSRDDETRTYPGSKKTRMDLDGDYAAARSSSRHS